ncbi:ABC transporter ATP-binding protein/permease [Christensenellaceae bacterium OttesenSCG-928-M15]|nr:ABC transporter ATP-binding protein/permease [Christensenellaceae bacterium OttesenSCG-928-M15]
MIKKFASFIGEYKRPTWLCPLMVVLEVAMDVIIPILMANIVNVGIQNGDIGYILKMGGLMLVMGLLALLFGTLAARFSATASAGFAKNLRGALFNKVQDFAFSNIDKFNTAGLVTRLTTDVTNTQQAFMMIIRMLVRSPIMLISAAVMAVSINPRLATVFLVAVPVLAILLGVIMYVAYPRFLTMLKAYDSMNEVVQENLIAMRVVKAFVREDHETDKFNSAADRVRNTMFKAEKLAVFVMPIMMLVMYGCILAIIWLGGNEIIVGDMLVGDLISFITYTTQILMSLMMLGMVFMMMIMSRASFTRIIEVLDEDPAIKDPKAPLTRVKDGGVEFKNVVFRYKSGSEQATLKDVSFKIEPGETVGMIGATGSAKTTLVQLIPRLYDVESGSILVGGHDVREYDLKALRDSVAMVLQKNVLFSGTIRDNLKWGNDNATDEEIASACRIAQAHGFIMSFKDGYDTDLGQGGVNVSGGQKQRLCIARALLKKPKIMILDDSTSAVDTATDKKMREGLKTSLGDMTTIVIAQRISSVMDSDKIIVMDEGCITAVGTHDELLATNEIYREVYTSQQKGAEENA